jgi:uncharacterized protein
MEPESPTPAPISSSDQPDSSIGSAGSSVPIEGADAGESMPEPRDLRWVFMGPEGLRAGWSVLLFIALIVVMGAAINFIMSRAHLAPQKGELSPGIALVAEFLNFIVLLLAVGIVARVERRRLLDYNLRGSRRFFHFWTGLVIGFAAISAVVGALAWGGWLHFGPVGLSGAQILMYAAIWGGMFLLVGCFEEGLTRCYLLYTLTRGINFWWAASLVGCMCGILLWRGGNGAGGVYIMAGAGVLPCLLLQLRNSPTTGFWNAAWFTSTLFGFAHTANHGETWIGIFSAAAIGFVFCVSVWVTGSAWWAIGCHAAWDWGETYFYGTADSGMVAKGHLLTSTPAGNALWSGGAAGPEGSLLIIPLTLVLMLVIVVLYGRRRQDAVTAPAVQQLAN